MTITRHDSFNPQPSRFHARIQGNEFWTATPQGICSAVVWSLLVLGQIRGKLNPTLHRNLNLPTESVVWSLHVLWQISGQLNLTLNSNPSSQNSRLQPDRSLFSDKSERDSLFWKFWGKLNSQPNQNLNFSLIAPSFLTNLSETHFFEISERN